MAKKKTKSRSKVTSAALEGEVLPAKRESSDFENPHEENETDNGDEVLDPDILESLALTERSTENALIVRPEQELLAPSGSDPLSLYMREISKYKLLTSEEEKQLTKELVETGNIEVAKRLVTANLRLVVKIAMEYRYAYQNVLDLIQEGNIGLMKAVSKYNPEKGAKLSYYASWWIRSYILKFILDNFHLVKIGTTAEQKKLFFNLIREKDRLVQLGQSPDIKTLSENLGVSEKSVVLMEERIGHGSTEFSLNRTLDGSESGRQTFEDLLADDSKLLEDSVADEQGLEILKEHLIGFMQQLKERDLEIFKKRLLSEVPSSLQSIADSYGVSRERIRQVEERLLHKLKVYMSDYLR